MVKVSNIFIGLKKTCLGVLDRVDCDKDNETDLKEGGNIEMSITVLHSRCSLFRLNTYQAICLTFFQFFFGFFAGYSSKKFKVTGSFIPPPHIPFIRHIFFSA